MLLGNKEPIMSDDQVLEIWRVELLEKYRKAVGAIASRSADVDDLIKAYDTEGAAFNNLVAETNFTNLKVEVESDVEGLRKLAARGETTVPDEDNADIAEPLKEVVIRGLLVEIIIDSNNPNKNEALVYPGAGKPVVPEDQLGASVSGSSDSGNNNANRRPGFLARNWKKLVVGATAVAVLFGGGALIKAGNDGKSKADAEALDAANGVAKQVQINTQITGIMNDLEMQVAAGKFNLSVEDYKLYQKASEKTGLSIKDMVKYSEYYGVDPENFGTKKALNQMRDEARGQRVGETLEAKTPKDAKKEILYAAFTNPAVLAQHINAVNEDVKTDSGYDGLEHPSKANKLLQSYIDDEGKYTKAFYKDYAEFRGLMKGAKIEVRGATSRAGHSYMFKDGKLVAVSATEDSNGSNEIVYIITMEHDGVMVVTANKNICGDQLWASKPAPGKLAPSIPKESQDPGNPGKVTPIEPEKPTPAPKKAKQDPSRKQQGGGQDKADTSNGEAKTPAGDNSSNPNKGEDRGNEKQPTEPKFESGA